MRRYLHGKVRLILARKDNIRHLVENLGQLARMHLANREHDGLAHFAANRVAQRVLHEGLAEDLIGAFGKEALLELALLEGFLLVLALVVLEFDHEAVFRQQLGGDFATRVHHGRIDQESVLHPIQ